MSASRLDPSDRLGARFMNMDKTTISVYLLDDHEVVREGIRNLLQKEPSITLVGDTGNPVTAIEEILRMEPDVVVLDICLHSAGMSGFEVGQAIRQEKPDQAIIMLTGFDSQLYATEALTMGASGFVTKERSRRILSLAIQLASEGLSLWDTDLLNNAVKRLSKGSVIMGRDSALKVHAAELNANEMKVFQLLKKGYSNKEICKELNFSDASVKKYVHNCIKKLGKSNRVQVALTGSQDQIGILSKNDPSGAPLFRASS